MFDIGFQELIIIFVVALLVVGPKKLPEVGRSVGRGIAELKKALQGVKDTIYEEGRSVTSELPDFKKALGPDIGKGLGPDTGSDPERLDTEDSYGTPSPPSPIGSTPRKIREESPQPPPVEETARQPEDDAENKS